MYHKQVDTYYTTPSFTLSRDRDKVGGGGKQSRAYKMGLYTYFLKFHRLVSESDLGQLWKRQVGDFLSQIIRDLIVSCNKTVNGEFRIAVGLRQDLRCGPPDTR